MDGASGLVTSLHMTNIDIKTHYKKMIQSDTQTGSRTIAKHQVYDLTDYCPVCYTVNRAAGLLRSVSLFCVSQDNGLTRFLTCHMTHDCVFYVSDFRYMWSNIHTKHPGWLKTTCPDVHNAVMVILLTLRADYNMRPNIAIYKDTVLWPVFIFTVIEWPLVSVMMLYGHYWKDSRNYLGLSETADFNGWYHPGPLCIACALHWLGYRSKRRL